MKKQLNLGCGGDLKEGYVNVDFEKFKGIDLSFDLNKVPYPFKKNEIEKVLMFNILEHLENPYEIMKEIYRICKPGAKIYLKVPHFSSNTAWADIQHKRGYSVETFMNTNLTRMFKIVENRIVFSRHYKLFEPLANRFPRAYEKLLTYLFPASYLKIVLIKK